MNPLVAEIKAAFVNESGFRIVPTLARAQVLAWMQSDDIEVQDTLFRQLGYKGERATIEPPLDLKLYHAFCLIYFRRCLCDYNDEPEWDKDEMETDYSFYANHLFVYWFDSLLRDKSIPQLILNETKAWLAKVLVECPEICGLMKSAISDHLLYRKATRKFFADWESDPYLSQFLE